MMVSYVVSVRFISGFVFGAGSGIAALKLYLYEEEKTDTGKTSSLVTNTLLINKDTVNRSIVHVHSYICVGETGASCHTVNLFLYRNIKLF